MTSALLDIVIWRGSGCWSDGSGDRACWRSRSGSSPAAIRSTARPGSARTACRFDLQAADDGAAAPSSPAPGSRSRRATTGSRASARSCAATRSTSCRTCGTWSAARCRSSARGRRCRTRSSSTPSASAAASRSSPGSPAGRRSTGAPSLPWSERIELDLWYVEHRSLALDLRILARTVGMVLSGHGLVQGRERRMAATDRVARPAHRGRQALRHRLGVRPACDRGRGRSESAGAGPVRRRPPASGARGSTTRSTSRRCRRCARARRRRGRAADRPRHRGARATPASPARCRRSSRIRRSPARRSTSTRRTCCSSGSGCPRRRRCCRASRCGPSR